MALRRQLRSEIETLIGQILINEQNERAAILMQIRKAKGWTAEIPEHNQTRQPGDWKTDLHLDIHTPEVDYIGVTWLPGEVLVCSDEMTEPYFEEKADFPLYGNNHAAIMDTICVVYGKMRQMTVEEAAELLKPVEAVEAVQPVTQ